MHRVRKGANANMKHRSSALCAAASCNPAPVSQRAPVDVVMFDDVCAGDVAVVGNGPLSDADRESIEKHQCVIRFNDTKNLREGEKTTILALREHVLSRIIRRTPADTVIWPVVFSKAFRAPTTPHRFLPAIPVYRRESGNHFADLLLFRNSKRAQRQGTTPAGPSTGTAIIDWIVTNTARTVDVYGMNWSGSQQHVDFRYPTLVRDCCTTCRIHETPFTTYLPEGYKPKKKLSSKATSRLLRRR